MTLISSSHLNYVVLEGGMKKYVIDFLWRGEKTFFTSIKVHVLKETQDFSLLSKGAVQFKKASDMNWCTFDSALL